MEGNSDSEVIEQRLKKRLQLFLSEMQTFGSLKGFRYFAMYLRGREEMLLSVINEPADADNFSLSSEPVSPLSQSFGSAYQFSTLNASLTSGQLPYDKRMLLLSGGTQRKLSGLGEIGVGLAPASPSDRESAPGDTNTTLFLLAAYAKYHCPYVWIRSNHNRLAHYTGKEDKDKDNPLKLKSTHKWKDTDVRVWDLVAEVVKLCTYPPPRNPFAVDFAFFETLAAKEKLLATGSMVHILQQIISSKPEDAYYTARVMEDLLHVTKVHFETLQQLSIQRQMPCLEKYYAEAIKQQQQQQQPPQLQAQQISSCHSARQHSTAGYYGGYQYS